MMDQKTFSNQLDLYCAEQDLDMLKYWRNHEDQYGILAHAAQDEIQHRFDLDNGIRSAQLVAAVRALDVKFHICAKDTLNLRVSADANGFRIFEPTLIALLDTSGKSRAANSVLADIAVALQDQVLDEDLLAHAFSFQFRYGAMLTDAQLQVRWDREQRQIKSLLIKEALTKSAEFLKGVSW